MRCITKEHYEQLKKHGYVHHKDGATWALLQDPDVGTVLHKVEVVNLNRVWLGFDRMLRATAVRLGLGYSIRRENGPNSMPRYDQFKLWGWSDL